MEAPVRFGGARVDGLALLVLQLLLRPGSIKAHECIHDTHIVPQLKAHPQHPFFTPQEDTTVSEGRRLGSVAERLQRRIDWAAQAGRRLAQGGFKFRIKPDYTYLDGGKYQCLQEGAEFVDVDGGGRSTSLCTADQVLTEQKRNHIKKLTEAAIDWYSKALKVLHPTRGPLQLRKYCYQYAPPPAADANTKIDKECWRLRPPKRCNFQVANVDFLLVVTAAPTEGNTLAYALTCQSDELTRRPISGLVNFGPGRLSGKAEKWSQELSTAIHEIAHALGFSSSRYQDYIDDQGQPLGIENVARQFTHNGRTVTKIITGNVIAHTQTHFGCFDWPEAGGELEDYGGLDTSGSHWEKRVFHDEFMTGTDSLNPVYSSITLALFEDTGWYAADYNEAQFFHWGYQAGCAFPMQQCSRWEEKFFCGVNKAKSCTHDWYYKGFCNVVQYTEEIPVQHRYFTSVKKGGTDTHADYCPYYQGWVNQDCRIKSFEGGSSFKIFGEVYGDNSRCFQATVRRRELDDGRKITFPDDEPAPRCYKTNCTDGRLSVFVYGKEFLCPVGGGKVKEALGIEKWEGEIWCPPAHEACNFETVKMALPDGVYSKAGADTVGEISAGGGAAGLVDRPQQAKDQKQGSTPQELLLGADPTPVSLGASQAAYFLLPEAEDVGRLVLITKGLKTATVYIRTILERFRRDDGQIEWKWARLPNAEDNDFSAAIDEEGKRIQVPKTLQDGGEQILVGIYASQAELNLKGSVRLTLDCQRPCANNGICVSGNCQCKPGWTGTACEDRQCPKDCSGHGKCNTVQGSCRCHVGYSGDACDHKDLLNSPQSGEVQIGQWAYFWIGCGDIDKEDVGSDYTLQYTMNKKVVSKDVASDPILYARKGASKPTVSMYEKRDIKSWKSSALAHEMTMRVRAGSKGGATIGIYNTAAYATGKLVYTGSSTCIPIDDEHEGCPSGANEGICSGKGKCSFSPGSLNKRCICEAGYLGDACDVGLVRLECKIKYQCSTKEIVVHQNTYQYMQIAVQYDDVVGRPLLLSLKGLQNWAGISLNRGTRKPDPANPRASDFHNYFDNGKFKEHETPSLRVKAVDTPVYTLMVRNTAVSDAKFAVSIVHESTKKVQEVVAVDKIPADFTSTENTKEQDEKEDEPLVPLDVIGRDGSLPRAVLILSSRTGVQGVASSTEMILIKVEEFCSERNTPTGLLYSRCSNIKGTMTICSDRAAKVYHELRSKLQPKETNDFNKMKLTQRGAPKKMWSHLPSWQDNCRYHTTVEISERHYYVGVAAVDSGTFVHINAVMRGESGVFFNDEGELHWWYLHGATMFCSSMSTALIFTAGLGGWCWRKKAKKKMRKDAEAAAAFQNQCEAQKESYDSSQGVPHFSPRATMQAQYPQYGNYPPNQQHEFSHQTSVWGPPWPSTRQSAAAPRAPGSVEMAPINRKDQRYW